jgi:WD40 repeat protein
VATGEELGLKGGHDGDVRLAHYSPDGKRIVTVAGARRRWVVLGTAHQGGKEGNTDHTARVWDSASGKELLVLQGGWHAIGGAEWSPDGTRLCTTHEDGVRVWDAVTGKELVRLGQNKGITSALFSPDGGSLLTWCDERVRQGSDFAPVYGDQADLWEASTGRHLATLQGHSAPVNFAAFSPDGRLLVTTAEQVTLFTSSSALGVHGRQEDTNSRDRTARVWDAATGRLVTVLRGHLRSVHSASFSKDGRFLVTTSDDRTARLWDASSGQEFFTLTGHHDGVKSAVFSPDGKYVVTASWDGTARLWPADPLPLARERMPRELSSEEKERFQIGRK